MATAGCPRAAGRGRHQLLPARVDGGQGNGLPRSPSPWVSWLRRRNRAWAVAATFSVRPVCIAITKRDLFFVANMEASKRVISRQPTGAGSVLTKHVLHRSCRAGAVAGRCVATSAKGLVGSS